MTTVPLSVVLPTKRCKGSQEVFAAGIIHRRRHGAVGPVANDADARPAACCIGQELRDPQGPTKLDTTRNEEKEQGGSHGAFHRGATPAPLRDGSLRW